jgi:hypothetical protein
MLGWRLTTGDTSDVQRVPPSWSLGWVTGEVYVFEKSEGTISSTFAGRIVRRAKIAVDTNDTGAVRVVRYGGKLWRLYPPEMFPELSKRWMAAGDYIYGDDQADLVLPLTIPFMFDTDKPLGAY